MVKICAISDTHNQLITTIPECDILLHCGDATDHGTYSELSKFVNWMHSLEQAKEKVFICGNHDFLGQKDPNQLKDIINGRIHYLCDSSVTLFGLKIYGIPWTPFFYDWAFNALEERGVLGHGYKGGPGFNAQPDKEHPTMKDVCSKIDPDTNILISHGPPRLGDLDIVGWSGGDKVGSVELAKAISNLKHLKAGFYGHIHTSSNCYPFTLNDAKHYNVCICDHRYLPTNMPTIIELD